jgi:UDP-sugar transporter A1/2/3
MRLSRVSKGIEFKMYYISTAVVISEFMKVIVSFIGCYYEDCGKDIEIMKEKIKTSSKWGDLLKISLPAGLYVLQNNLQYIAMSNLPAEVYQVLIQGKIITTALFSILVLNRRYSFVQWTSILALSLGVGLVQFSLKTSAVASNNINFAIGITSVLVSTLTSGFASVFLEKMLKSKGGFWIRNIQLSSVSFIIASLGCLIQDFNVVSTGGFFTGYNPLVLSVIFTQALGGMLVAFVVRYTNSIVKGFAASGSIILSCIISAIFLNDYKLGRLFTLGTGMVCASALTWAVSPTPSVGRVDTIESVKDLVGVASDPNISEVIEIQEDLVGVTSEVNEIQENNQENIQDNNYQEKRP